MENIAAGTPWLFNNLQLRGLDDTDRARSLFICVRELFENALDASCRAPVAKAHHIVVSVAPVCAHTGLHAVAVTDDGPGFSEEKLHMVGVRYSSDKSTRNEQLSLAKLSALSAGVFGGGLNTVLVWAHMHGGEPVSITSVGSHCAEPNDVLKLNAALHVRQNPLCTPALGLWTNLTRHRQVVSAGTRISCVLAGGDAVAEHLEPYFACVTSLCVPSELRITLNLLLDGHSGEAAPENVDPQQRGLKIPAIPFDHIWLQTHPAPTINGAVNQLLEQALNFGCGLLTTHGVGKAVVENSSVTSSAATDFVHATLLLGVAYSAATDVCTPNIAADLATSFADSDNHADSDDLRHHPAAVEVGQRHEDVDHFSGYFTTAEGAGVGAMHSPSSKSERRSSSPLRLLLFLNNKPLRLYWAEPPVQCAAFAALRKVSWKAAGLGLRMRPLQLVGGHTPLRGAWAIVHLRDPAARFGDISRSYVQPTKPLTKAISAAVTNALAQAREGWAQSGLLLSAEERWCQELGRSTEHIARNVSGLVAVLRHADERRECLHLLGAVDAAACEGVVRRRLRCEWQHITHTQVQRRQSKSRPGVVIDDDSCLFARLSDEALNNDYHDDFDPIASLALPGEHANKIKPRAMAHAPAHAHVRRGVWHRWTSSSRSSTTQALGRKRGTPDDFEFGAVGVSGGDGGD